MPRLNNDTRSKMQRLRIILQASCHANGCREVLTCPRHCRCRTQRTFKLNTETSMCWELGDHIWMLSKYDNPTMGELDDLIKTSTAYDNLTRYHMSRGWQRFFRDVLYCIQSLCEPACYDYMRSDEFFKKLESRVKRLKREPK